MLTVMRHNKATNKPSKKEFLTSKINPQSTKKYSSCRHECLRNTSGDRLEDRRGQWSAGKKDILETS